ncbi:hypothetical protein PFICI_01649 [Pestalotiopsis fici W106-1]|uniref:AA1-like domain-containing protein n=1 Tax=Pestalotiopsis fici (strain W106-1 / CGMCC3.15140) TaxID=1229662 RepID=W3XRI2_PESFW|nr:uncharacterized protein PFICI_01649 [Pestalotiopsis fici W106-1]ETS87821.1 hypothetical protein PFICI_01649 [Pestalotiopsis fici W106-1]
MKTFAAISALFLSAASAAPLEQRQATEFDITNFSANTIPHGTGAFMSYDIEIPGVLSTTCSYSDQTSVGHLPDITPYRPCDDASVTWQWRQIQAGPTGPGPYLLVILYTDPATSAVVDGSKEWPSTDFPVEDQGSSVAQFYRGEPNFVITV